MNDFAITASSYGKSRVRLVKVERHPDHHDLLDLTIHIQFTGAYDESYSPGDNSRILPTDTMKNTVYALAATQPVGEIEQFGQRLAAHFIDGDPHLHQAQIRISERLWTRMSPHAFRQADTGQRTTQITAVRDRDTAIQSGVKGLLVLKTAGSSFEGYIHDAFTTLKETSDRIFATAIDATWSYASTAIDFGPAWFAVRQSILDTFAAHISRSVQHTLHAIGEAVLRDFPAIQEIALSLPNQHCLPVDLAPFGIENRNEIFVPVDEPHGMIEATLRRP